MLLLLSSLFVAVGAELWCSCYPNPIVWLAFIFLARVVVRLCCCCRLRRQFPHATEKRRMSLSRASFTTKQLTSAMVAWCHPLDKYVYCQPLIYGSGSLSRCSLKSVWNGKLCVGTFEYALNYEYDGIADELLITNIF